ARGIRRATSSRWRSRRPPSRSLRSSGAASPRSGTACSSCRCESRSTTRRRTERSPPVPRTALSSHAPMLAAALAAFGTAFAAARVWNRQAGEPLPLGNVVRAAGTALGEIAIPGESARRRRRRPARRTASDDARHAPAAPRGVRGFYRLLVDTVSRWIADFAPSMGAALSYYTLFSLAPLLLIIVSVAGLVFGEEAARGEVFAQLQGLLGDDGASAVENLLAGVQVSGKGPLGSVLGIVLLAVGATTVFGELQSALDRIWR